MENTLSASGICPDAQRRERASVSQTPCTSDRRYAVHFHVFLIVLAMIPPTFVALTPIGHAEELKVNDSWRFQLDPESKGTSLGWDGPELDDAGWLVLQAGKSWATQGYFNYSGTAWYRKRIEIPSEFQGRFLIFYGAKIRAERPLSESAAFARRAIGKAGELPC